MTRRMLAPPPPAAVARPPRGRRRRRRRLVRRVGVNLLGLLVFVVMVFPVYWMVSTAFKPSVDILTLHAASGIPSPATLDNFRDAIDRPVLLGRASGTACSSSRAVDGALARPRVPRRARALEVPLLRPEGVHRR